MAKRIIALSTAIILLFCMGMDAYAHPEQGDHDDELKDVLFGDDYNFPSEEAKKKFQDIADAASLCIDQFSANKKIHSKENLFNSLNERIGFSFSFDDIDLQIGKVGINVTASNHRRYTHRGWNFQFTENRENKLGKLWKQRKKILTATVNKELFGKSSGILSKLPFLEGILYSEEACNPQCEAFCVLVYCIHILGDYEEAKSYSSEFQQLIPLARHEDLSSPALIRDIISAAKVLFAGQRNLNLLIDELEKIENEAEDLLYAQGGIRTQEQFKEYKACSEKVYDTLKKMLPVMLRNVDFFSKAFPR